MAGGIYNETYFRNNPEEAGKDAVLYCVVLVNKETYERECIKIGIAKGRNWKDVIRRSIGFTGYDIKIQKIVPGKLEEIYHLEQLLHEKWADRKFAPTHKFGGYTECFEVDPEIIRSVPSKKL